MRLYQLNLQRSFGGAEAYTAFCCRALAALGMQTTLLVDPAADFWQRLDLGEGTRCVPVSHERDLLALLQASVADPVWLLTHAPLPEVFKQPHAGLLVSGFAHMPVQGRDPVRAYGGYDMLFAVSAWVRDGLQQAGIPVWPEPMFGVADLKRQASPDTAIVRRSRYDWDRRKFRDRVYGWCEPAVEALRPMRYFQRHPGLTLGIVSRITPIKQFPLLFARLAPILARHPHIHLEIFGSGGYASIRDLQTALAPCAGQVRFWGQQADVAMIYSQLDYLLTGLPEKEALGLNVIEAQTCGLPVIAVAAAPFTETILDGQTGFLYTDPRQDDGVDFERLLTQIETVPRPEPRHHADHLARFTLAGLSERLRPVVTWAQARLHP